MQRSSLNYRFVVIVYGGSHLLAMDPWSQLQAAQKVLEIPVTIPPPPEEVVMPVHLPSVASLDRPWEFHIVLSRVNTDAKFGIRYQVDNSSNHLVIQTVKPNGVCAQHNWEMCHFPTESQLFQSQVGPADEILMVNGQTDPPMMKQELFDKLTVHLRLVRLPAAEKLKRLRALAADYHLEETFITEPARDATAAVITSAADFMFLPSNPRVNDTPRAVDVELAVGSRVCAWWSDAWYEGTVYAITQDGKYTVQWTEDGTVSNLPKDHVWPQGPNE